MAEPHAPGAGRAPAADDQIDWEAVEHSPEFQELVRARKSFVLPATLFFLSWYMGFILLTAFAEDFMADRVYEGLTVGYVLALTQFLMVLVLGLSYLSRSAKTFDPLAKKAIERYAHQDTDEARARRTGAGAPPPDEPVGSRAAR